MCWLLACYATHQRLRHCLQTCNPCLSLYFGAKDSAYRVPLRQTRTDCEEIWRKWMNCARKDICWPISSAIRDNWPFCAWIVCRPHAASCQRIHICRIFCQKYGQANASCPSRIPVICNVDENRFEKSHFSKKGTRYSARHSSVVRPLL